MMVTLFIAKGIFERIERAGRGDESRTVGKLGHMLEFRFL